MKFTHLAVALFTALLVAGCAASPEQAARNRAALTDKVFPDPADRQGVFLTFPLESAGVYNTLEVLWFPDQVTQGEIVRRVQGFCLRQGTTRFSGKVGIKKDLGTKAVTLANGQKKMARGAFFSCL